MGRDHHALLRCQTEEIGGALVGFWLRLVGARYLGAQHGIPGQARALGHVHQQRYVAIGEGGEDVFALEPRQPFDRVGPGIEAVPGVVQIGDLGFRQARKAEAQQ